MNFAYKSVLYKDLHGLTVVFLFIPRLTFILKSQYRIRPFPGCQFVWTCMIIVR